MHIQSSFKRELGGHFSVLVNPQLISCEWQETAVNRSALKTVYIFKKVTVQISIKRELASPFLILEPP